MSNHRVITTREQLAALQPLTVLVDSYWQVLERSTDWWNATGRDFQENATNPFTDDMVMLPARVLLESWER